jgi:hypothetical protein
MSDKIRLRHGTGEMIRFRPKVATEEKSHAKPQRRKEKTK